MLRNGETHKRKKQVGGEPKKKGRDGWQLQKTLKGGFPNQL